MRKNKEERICITAPHKVENIPWEIYERKIAL
jgi:hypothetical protein